MYSKVIHEKELEHAEETTFLRSALPVRRPISLLQCCDPHVNTRLTALLHATAPVGGVPLPPCALTDRSYQLLCYPGACPGYVCKPSSASANPFITLLALLLNLPSERSRKNCVPMRETLTLWTAKWICTKKLFQSSLFPSYCCKYSIEGISRQDC